MNTAKARTPGVQYEVMADGDHPYFEFFAELGFFKPLLPGGLSAAIDELGNAFPEGGSPFAEDSLGDRLRVLVEDVCEYLSQEFRKFWADYMDSAERTRIAEIWPSLGQR